MGFNIVRRLIRARTLPILLIVALASTAIYLQLSYVIPHSVPHSVPLSVPQSVPLSVPQSVLDSISTTESTVRSSIPSDAPAELAGYRRVVIFDAVDHTGSLSFLAKPPPDWKPLVINHHTPQQMDSCRRCVFVSATWADGYLGTRESASLTTPMKVKMDTYLYLTSLELEWVYVTNKAQDIPYEALSRVVDKNFTTSMVHAGQEAVFEPCHHFVDPVTWQRPGSPIGPPGRYTLKQVPRHSVYYVVDECFHSDVTEERWKESLDERAPIPFVTAGTFAVLDFNNALIPKEAMWTLIATVPSLESHGSEFSVSSLKLNLVVQRILWETQNLIGFLPSLPKRKTCDVCSLASNIQKLGGDFRRILTDWRCANNKDVISCLKDLAKTALETDTYNLVQMWLTHTTSQSTMKIIRQPLTSQKISDKFSGRQVVFSPGKLLRNRPGNDSSPPNPFVQICSQDGKLYDTLIPNAHLRTNILVIIVINDGRFVKNIPFMEYMYGRTFKHIIYCSTRLDFFQNTYLANHAKHPVSFITMPHSTNTQLCTTGAMRMNYDVTGYLQYSDDVLVNLWNYHDLPLDQPWFQFFIGSGPRTERLLFRPKQYKDHMTFVIWTAFRSQMNRAWDSLQRMKKDPVNGPRVSKFFDTLALSTNCSNCIHYANADIYYLPHAIAEDFIFFAEFIDKFQVHFELTVLSALGGIVPSKNIIRLDGQYLFGYEQRESYASLYKTEEQFLHPFKFSELSKPKGPIFLCQKFIRNLDLDIHKQTLLFS